jgi:hypothetical protein
LLIIKSFNNIVVCEVCDSIFYSYRIFAFYNLIMNLEFPISYSIKKSMGKALCLIDSGKLPYTAFR